MNSPVSIANKRLKLELSFLDATLTKKWGGGAPLDVQTVTPPDRELTALAAGDSPVTALPIPAITSAIMRKKLKTNYL
jgi:hypothetical protein